MQVKWPKEVECKKLIPNLLEGIMGENDFHMIKQEHKMQG